MKKVWVKVIPWDKKIVTTALESGVDALYVSKGDTEKVKKIRIKKFPSIRCLSWMSGMALFNQYC